MEWAIEWAILDDTAGVLADDTALLWFSSDPSCQWWGPNNRFLVEEHSQGLASLTAPTVCDTVPEGSAQIIFDAYVKNISRSKRPGRRVGPLRP